MWQIRIISNAKRRFELGLKTTFLCVWLTFTVIPSTAETPTDLPQSWLAWATLSDLTSTEQLGDELLKPFGMQLVGFKQVLHQFAGDSLAMDRPVVFGAAFSDASQSPAAFALIPIDDFQQFTDRQGLSLEEELWLTSFFGVDLVMVQVEDYLWITQLDADLSPASKSMIGLISESRDEVSLQFSNRGLEELADWLNQNKSELLKSTRGRLPRVSQPKNLAQLLRQSIRYSPITSKLSQDYSTLKLSFQRNEDDLLVSAALSKQPGNDAAAKDDLQNLLEKLGSIRLQFPINQDRAMYQASGNLGKGIVDLVLSAYGCHPESIEAITYDETSYQAYEKACLEISEAITSIEFISHNPDNEQPIARNEIMIINVDPKLSMQETAERFTKIGTSWNSVVDNSRARVKLNIVKTDEKLFSESENKGESLDTLVYSIDMIDAFGGTRYQEIEDLFESLYGVDCKLKIRLVPIKNNRWVLSLLPKSETKEAVGKILSLPAMSNSNHDRETKTLTAIYYPDKHLSWLRKIDDLMFKDSVGRKVKKPMKTTAPIKILFTESQEGADALAEVPMETYQAGIQYLIAPKTKTQSEKN